MRFLPLDLILFGCFIFLVFTSITSAELLIPLDYSATIEESLDDDSSIHDDFTGINTGKGEKTGFTITRDENVVSIYRYRHVSSLPEYLDSILVFYKKDGVWNSRYLVNNYHINPSIGGDIGCYIQKTVSDTEVYYYTATFGDFRVENYYRWKLSDPANVESIEKSQFKFEDSAGVYVWDFGGFKMTDPNWDVPLAVYDNKINATDLRTTPHQSITVFDGNIVYSNDPSLSHGSYPGPVHSFTTILARLTSMDSNGNWEGDYLIYQSPRHADTTNRTWTNTMKIPVQGSAAGFYNKFTTQGPRISILINQPFNITFTNKWTSNNTPMAGYVSELVRWNGTSWETSPVADSRITNSLGLVEFTILERTPGTYYYRSHLPAIPQSWSNTITILAFPRPNPDIGVFRSYEWNNWIFDRSMDGSIDTRDHYGSSTDKPVIGDLNNDGNADRALFRAGEWIIDYNIDGSVNSRLRYGQTGDIPLAGSMNADGIIDRAVFRSGQWILDFDSDGDTDLRNNYGTTGDIPLIGDFNNDGTPDRAVFRPTSASENWIIDYSMDGSVNLRNRFGQNGDLPLIGDFNNDGNTDRAVFRAGEWIIDYGMDGSINARPRFGKAGDIPLVWNP